MPRRIVDLTRPLSSDHGDEGFVAREFERQDAGHTVHHRVEMDAGVGTHVVAPRRLFSWGDAIGDLRAETFFGEGLVARFDRSKVEREIGPAQLGEVVGQRLKRGDIVVLTVTGGEDEGLGLSSAGAQWLETRGAKLVAIDERIKLGGPTDGYRERNVLMMFLQSNVPVIFGITNTDRLSSERLAIMALPVPAEGLDAWPVRVIALDPGEPPQLEAKVAVPVEPPRAEPQPEDEGMEERIGAAEQETEAADAGEADAEAEEKPAEETSDAAERESSAPDTVEGEAETAPPETEHGAETAQADEDRGEPPAAGEDEESARATTEP